MSLSALNWRKLPVQTLVDTTIVGILDAIYTAFTSVTYYDATARTAGAGSAWTFTRYQNAGTTEATYGTPPTDTLNSRAIFGGAAGAKTPTMAGSDTWAVNMLLAGHNKNSGAFNAWDAASPFTSGQFHGYERVFNAGGASAAAKVHCYESQEMIHIVIEDAAGAMWGGPFVGAILDPESTDVTNDAESDGKLYGMINRGSGGSISSTFHGSSGSADVYMTQSTGANGAAHCTVYTPGGSALLTLFREANPSASTTTSKKSRAGRFQRTPICYVRSAAAPNDNMMGRLREVVVCVDAKIGNFYREAGVDKGYFIAGSASADQDAIMLLY